MDKPKQGDKQPGSVPGEIEKKPANPAPAPPPPPGVPPAPHGPQDK